VKDGTSEDEKLRNAIVKLKESDRLPEKAALERVLEETGKCGKCEGRVRALIEEVHRAGGLLTDLEFLVSLRCRDAVCAWTARMWRPWSASRPLEL